MVFEKIFCEKLENSKWLPFLATPKFFENWDAYFVGQKFHPNRSILQGFRHISIFMFCNFYEKFEMAAILGETKFFLKIRMATLQRYPVGQKFCGNCSILHGFRDISSFVFCNLCKKNRKFKLAAIFGETRFFRKMC